MNDIPKRLADFLMACWDEAVQMRAAGVSLEDIQRGLKPTVIDGARARGMICADRDLPPWFLKRCQACLDAGWEPTTRMVRGEVVEAFKRCTCHGAGIIERQSDHAIAAKISNTWKQVGRR